VRSAAAGLGVDQRHRILELHRLRGLVGRQRRIDAVVTHIRAIAAVLGDDRPALDRMLAQGAPGIRAEPPAPSALALLLRNQGDGTVEPDVEPIVSGLETRVGLAVLHVGAISTEAGDDRLARLRMHADLPW